MNSQTTSNRPEQVILVTNIPAPYRTFLYDALQDELATMDIDFCVHYLATTEPDRHWTFDGTKVRHRHCFEPGFHLKSSTYRHINPGTPFRLARLENTLLIVGGYDNFATLMLTLLPSRHSTVRVLWTESNYHSESRKGGVATAVKRHAIGSFDGYLVPGAWARQFVVTHCPESAAKPFVTMPNTIDEESFLSMISNIDVAKEREQAGIGRDDIMVFVSARLEDFKNVLFTISCLPNNFWEHCVVCIAGTGTELAALGAFARDRGLEHRLRLLGQMAAEQMPKWYLMADLFLLPSLKDPSPLSCVEAITCGRPLALSSSVGNHPELLIHGENGYLFDPRSKEEIACVATNISRMSRVELGQWGERSREIASECFATKKVVTATVSRLLDIYATQRSSRN